MPAGGQNFFGCEAGHAAAIEWADLEKAGAAGNFVTGDGDGIAERAGPSRLGGSEDGNPGSAQKRGQVHGATVVTENEAGMGNPMSEVEGGGFS